MLRRQNSPLCLNWQFLFVGLFFIIMQCDARAVNVSNTWTMPQEGLNVFYRFFRDRISWFEADAVCQFHHANLVTVDNSFQFDATRDLLRELDVNDIVWIGLMRPQSSDRFMWSNSRPLVADTGYWAESLPLMDAPLCAVIDPIRDYRWHALRCGGPETASFLCEMPVPSWADACNLKDMPNLTLQYMADTASIELIRNCQEEGLLRTMCKGKQDRERAMQDLICPRERLEAQRINDITNSHFKSLQIINSIPSDNNENNDIELLPFEVNYGPHYPEELQTEKNTVQRLIEQFNVDELMQADEPSNMETVSSFYKIPGLIPKPVKKSGKKLPDFNKNSKAKDKVLLEEIQKIKKPLNMDDIMMGDQPTMQGELEMPEQLLNEEVSNEILEPLPHIKKTNIHKEDMEKMEKEAIALKKNMLKTKEMETKKMLIKMASTTTTTTSTSTTTEQPKTFINPVILGSTTEKSLTANARESNTRKEDFFNRGKEHDSSAISPASIGHPMHPVQQQQQQQQLNIHNFNSLNQEQHQQQQQHNNKEAADNSHFIPPMLLVKSHYVPPASNKHGHNIEHEHEHHIRTHYLDTTTEQQQQQQQHQIRNQTATDLNKTTMRTSTTTTTTVVTPTALVFDLENPAFKALDTSSSSGIKVIAEQPLKETEKHKNFENLKNLHTKEIQATQTTTETTLHSSSVSFKRDNAGGDDDGSDDDTTGVPNTKPNAIQELKPPQTLNADAETTVTTELLVTTAAEKSQKSFEKLYELQTETTENKQQKMEILEPLTTTTTTTTEAVVALQTFQPRITSRENTHKEDGNVETTMQTEEEKENEKRKGEEKPGVIQTETTQANEITTTTTAETAIVKEAIQTETLENKPDNENENDNDNDNKPVLITNKQKQHKEQVHEEEDEEEKEEKETIVKTTEILATHTLTTTPAEHKENKVEEEKQNVKPATVTTLTPIITITTTTIATTTTTNDNNKTPITTPATIATTTTVKPITTTTPATTTLPQNEVKSTETSVSSTTTATTTTRSSSLSTTSASNSPTANTGPPLTTTELAAVPITTTTTINDDTFSSTIFKTSQSTSTTLQKQSQTDKETDRDTNTDTATQSETNTATTERASAIVTSMEIATQTLTPPPMPPSSPSSSPSPSSPPAPETTRNFLKSTTEMPFKPNRRRSLTKPETVSYMKKILG